MFICQNAEGVHANRLKCWRGTCVADKKYCLLQLEYCTLERITKCQARSYEDQDCESLKQLNLISTKHEKRYRHAHLSILCWMDIHQTNMVTFPSNTRSTNTFRYYTGTFPVKAWMEHALIMRWSCSWASVTIEIWLLIILNKSMTFAFKRGWVYRPSSEWCLHCPPSDCTNHFG